MEFIKTNLPVGITVSSVISVHHMVLNGQIGGGEAHDFPELVYVEKGPHSLCLDGEYIPMEEGQLILYAPGAYHGPADPSTATLSVVSFETDSKLLEGFYNRPVSTSIQQRTLLSRIITLGLEIFQRRNLTPGQNTWLPRTDVRVFELQQMKNLLELLLIDLMSEPNGCPQGTTAVNRDNFLWQQYEMVTEYMQTHIGQMLTMVQICDGCGLSPSALKRICHTCCGQSPMSYFTNLKLRMAKALIRETSLNFSQIAEKLGFSSVHYFSRVFREKTGMTLSDYARSMQKD